MEIDDQIAKEIATFLEIQGRQARTPAGRKLFDAWATALTPEPEPEKALPQSVFPSAAGEGTVDLWSSDE